MQRELHDHYFHQAKREGYVSRAAYKLIEIDDRRKLLARGQSVLDCGCAPGSWLQVAAKRVGERGTVAGIDLNPVAPQVKGLDNVHTMVGDMTSVDLQTLADLSASDGRFDVMLSDMAPSTTGIRDTDHHRSIRLCEYVLELCPRLLKPRGHLVMKVFEGEAYAELLKRVGQHFDKCKGAKPKASRSISTEMYIVAEGFRATSDNTTTSHSKSTDAEAMELPKRRPSKGWTR